MFEFKKLGDKSVLTGIISKEIFNALNERKTIVNVNGEEEKIDEIKSFEENGPHIRYEGRENFIEVCFLPSENQKLEEIGPSEIILSQIDLKAINKGSFNSNCLEILDKEFIQQFGKYATKQFIKIKVVPI